MPWSAPLQPDTFINGSFDIDHGPGGTACPPSPLPLNPSFTAGSANAQAGAFTSFSTLLQRGDGQQRISTFQIKAPDGFAGMISNVPACPEPQASAGNCSEASRIGHVIVTAGPGPYPLVLPQPGEPESPIYLTGPYDGAPFGLSIVTPVIAGPFDLGTIVTRARIEVDPHTAQVTVTTDPLPQIIDGVPTDIRSIYAVIDRPKFIFNPTNCTPQEFTGTAYGTAPPGGNETGQTAPLSSKFAIGGCRELAFKPKFSASTDAKTSKADGASLNVKLTFPGATNSGSSGSGTTTDHASPSLMAWGTRKLSSIGSRYQRGI